MVWLWLRTWKPQLISQAKFICKWCALDKFVYHLFCISEREPKCLFGVYVLQLHWYFLGWRGVRFENCIQRPHCFQNHVVKQIWQLPSCWKQICGEFAEGRISVDKSQTRPKGSSLLGLEWDWKGVWAFGYTGYLSHPMRALKASSAPSCRVWRMLGSYRCSSKPFQVKEKGRPDFPSTRYW